MHVAEAAAIGVDRQLAARRGVAIRDEFAGLFMRHEAEVAEAEQRQVREGVVDHHMIDVLVGDAGLAERGGPRDTEGARGVERFHLADHGRFHALAGAEDVDRLLRKILGAIGAGQDQRAAAVGDEAALQDPERVGDHARVQHVRNGDRLLHGGARILRRPFPLHHGHHGDLLVGDAVGLHVAQHRNRKHAGRTVDTERGLELAVEAVRWRRARQLADHRLAAFGVGDQHGLAQAGFDRGRGVADMQHEGAAADRGAVDPGRRDAEIVGDLLRRLHGGRDPVDVRQFQPGIRDRIESRVRMKLDLRHVGDDTEFGGFSRADDGHLVPAHDGQPFAGRNTGRVIASSSFSNAASSFMSSTSASGVWGQSMMLVIMRGPSSSVTTAMA